MTITAGCSLASALVLIAIWDLLPNADVMHQHSRGDRAFSLDDQHRIAQSEIPHESAP